MIFKSIFLLISLAWSAQSQGYLNQENVPVFLRELKYVVIDGYHGRMDARTMELFNQVETLTLQNCNLTVLNENYVQPLKNLQKLILANSQVEKFEQGAAVCCQKLRELEVYDQTLIPVDEAQIKKLAALTALERVYFHRVNIPVLKAKSFAGSNLKTIEIQYSNLATIEDGALHGIENLEVLNLQHDKLKTIPTSNLAALKNLKELNLKENFLEIFTAADFPLLPNLEKLNIGHNPIKHIDLKGLKEKLPKIKEVDVSGINIDLTSDEGVPLIKIQIG